MKKSLVFLGHQFHLEAESNQGPSAYPPNSSPLGQSCSQMIPFCKAWIFKNNFFTVGSHFCLKAYTFIAKKQTNQHTQKFNYIIIVRNPHLQPKKQKPCFFQQVQIYSSLPSHFTCKKHRNTS